MIIPFIDLLFWHFSDKRGLGDRSLWPMSSVVVSSGCAEGIGHVVLEALITPPAGRRWGLMAVAYVIVWELPRTAESHLTECLRPTSRPPPPATPIPSSRSPYPVKIRPSLFASIGQHWKTISALKTSFVETVWHFTSPLCPILLPSLPQQMVIPINHPNLNVCLRAWLLCSIADENSVLHSDAPVHWGGLTGLVTCMAATRLDPSDPNITD